MSTKSQNAEAELDSFLPQDNSNTNGITKYKLSSTGDVESNHAVFDPFKARQLAHPVSNCDTLTHLLKASLGTGILSMPAAFKASGLGMGIFLTIVVSVICTHCSYILVTSAHELYKKTRRTQMSFGDVAEESCLRGPAWGKKFAPYARQIIQIGLLVTYFMTCSCYTVIMANNFNYVVNHYIGYEIEVRKTIAILLVPLIFLVYVPNLKYLAPFSMAANGFMAVSLGITFYYLVINLKEINSVPMVAPISTMPIFFSITIFAIEAIGVIMPLENNMGSPQSFVGLCGVLNQGMSGVTLVYILIGFFGYLAFGDNVAGAVTLNLPKNAYAAQAVNILVGGAVFCTFGLQFYVCIDIMWNFIKDRYAKRQQLANYVMRTVMTFLCVTLAIAVPTIVPFVSLIGAFCFSILGLAVPIVIEMLTFWDKGFGKFNWKIYKNIVVVVVAVMALIFGSKSAIEDIIEMYSSNALMNNDTLYNSTSVSSINASSILIETTTDLSLNSTV
ncbi:proton-coupled amino acid transporter-like protein pathetic [Diorhabda sublineata]|uniref:proton-coupled amino acid transporter-like protein pathetic n=1 Tax=Diorhabda sublineata TaxID=1163346 RepID=UPI0024E155C0|nr:proton-coupled amino acid transporter-like protein pathetic [Diorhabda sublineata]